MSHRSKQEVLMLTKARYQKSGRMAKTKILDEFCALTELDRKHAIKLMKGKTGCRQNQAGRKKIYGEAAKQALMSIWQSTDQMCSKRLKAALPEWIGYYEKHNGCFTNEVREQLLAISPAQMDRLLASRRIRTGLWRRPKPGSLVRSNVPIMAGPWDIHVPGHLEVDTVAHCEGSMAGNFIWSITFTDIASGWTCLRAMWNCGQHGVVEQTKDVEGKLPFELIGFDSDNGHEFINHHLYTYLTGRPKKVNFTRSRPYHKNDNAHVEQKNWTHVRQLLGDFRLDDPKLVSPLNDLYSNAWEPFHNFFCPAMKLISKERIGSRYKKKYDEPKTPYQRLMECEHLSDAQKYNLQEKKDRLDPFELKKAIEEKLEPFRLLIASPCTKTKKEIA